MINQRCRRVMTFVFDLRPAACLNDHRSCRIEDTGHRNTPGACVALVGTESAHHESVGATLRLQQITIHCGSRARGVREVICD